MRIATTTGNATFGAVPEGNTRLKIVPRTVEIASNSTNYQKAVYVSGLNFYDINSGVTDSGYRIAVDASVFVSDADFEGTLANQYAIWARHGAKRFSCRFHYNTFYRSLYRFVNKCKILQ